MDGELREALGKIERSHQQTETNLRAHIEKTSGRLEGKLDLMNQQFNQHLIDDTKEFTILQQKQQQLADRLRETEEKRKEDSERRLQKIEAQKNREDQWKIARYGAIFLVVAAIVGSLVASCMTYVEHRSERTQNRVEHPAK